MLLLLILLVCILFGITSSVIYASMLSFLILPVNSDISSYSSATFFSIISSLISSLRFSFFIASSLLSISLDKSITGLLLNFIFSISIASCIAFLASSFTFSSYSF